MSEKSRRQNDYVWNGWWSVYPGESETGSVNWGIHRIRDSNGVSENLKFICVRNHPAEIFSEILTHPIKKLAFCGIMRYTEYC